VRVARAALRPWHLGCADLRHSWRGDGWGVRGLSRRHNVVHPLVSEVDAPLTGPSNNEMTLTKPARLVRPPALQLISALDAPQR
jgi:hypothetical protein